MTGVFRHFVGPNSHPALCSVFSPVMPPPLACRRIFEEDPVPAGFLCIDCRERL
jgi:hypothetical protein